MAIRSPRVPEKVEQQHIVGLLRSIGAKVYVLGTRRPRGDFQGTRQTPGICDVLAFLPLRTVGARGQTHQLLAVEVKARDGRLRPEQVEFRGYCDAAGIAHIVGGLDAVIAWLMAGGFIQDGSVPHYRQPAAAGDPS